MKLNPVITRLAAQCPTAKLVEPAWGLNAVQDFESAGAQLPAIFVHPVEESAAGGSTLDNCVAQLVRVRFGVLIVAYNADVGAGSEPLEDLRAEVSTSLLGWEPTDADGMVEYASGKIVDMDRKLVWWRDVYAVDVHRRAV